MRKFWVLSLLIAPAVWLVACGSGDKNQSTASPPAGESLFSEIALEANLDYRWGYLSNNVVDINEVHNFCGGVAVGDVDLDGLLDLFVVRGNIGPHLLYRNLGDNKFNEIASTVGIGIENHRGCGPTFADIDGDDDLDLFIGGIAGERSYLLINQLKEEGTLSFVDRTAQYGLDQITAVDTISSSFGDYDLDGRLDLFLAHWGTLKSETRQHLWRNINGVRFENASRTSQVSPLLNRTPLGGAVRGAFADYTFLGSFADISNDGYPDLLVVADFRTSQVLINQRDGTFVNDTTSVIKDENGMGSAIGDMDNDGDLDWFVTAIFNSNSPGNRFYQNQGTKENGSVEFVDMTFQMGIADGHWGWGACMADFNLDGILDIFHVNGWNADILGVSYRKTNSRLYLSTGDFLASGLPELVNIPRASGIINTTQGRGVACFDADNDGDVDILAINNDTSPVHFYRNNTKADKNFLTVRLQGSTPNTSATGARIYVKTGEVEQMREINIGSNFTSHNPTQQYFGLGEMTSVDVLRVEWRDGKTNPATPDTIMRDIDADQHLTITHPQRSSPPS